MKTNQLTKIGILLFGITFLFLQCNTDETFETTLEVSNQKSEVVSFEEAKQFFSNKQQELKQLRKSKFNRKSTSNGEPDIELTPDWNSLSQDSIFYSSSLLTKADVEINRSGNYSSYLYFVKKNDQIKNVIFTIFKKELDANGNVLEAYLFFNDLDGTFLDAYKIENGAFRKKLVPKPNANIQKAGFLMMLLQTEPTEVFWCDGGVGGDLEEVVVVANPRTGGSYGHHTGNSFYGSFGPRYGNFFGQTYSGTGNDPIGNGGGISESDIASGAGALALNPITLGTNEECPQGFVKFGTTCVAEEEYFEEQVFIDQEFKDNPCLKSVYDKMGKTTKFKEYLQNFEPEFSVAHLRLSASSNLSSSVNAETSAPKNYTIGITFNTNNLNRPALSIARTFIHEMIHAEIFRKLLSVAQSPRIALTQSQLIQLRNDYPGLYDYYMRWKWNIPEGQNPNDAQHEAMSSHYREIIEQALREYDGTQLDEVYEALAWTGLMGEGTFNNSTGLYSNSTQAWKNLAQNERLNIISRINTFNSTNNNCQ